MNSFDGGPEWEDVTLKELGAKDLKSEIPFAVVEMMNEFNGLFAYPTDIPKRESLLKQFIENPDLGRCWVFMKGQVHIGYLILAFGFSFEYGGRDGFIDEIYLRSPYRNQGLGRLILEFICRVAVTLGVQTLHLEVKKNNLAGQSLYAGLGFQNQDRLLLHKKLNPVLS